MTNSNSRVPTSAANAKAANASPKPRHRWPRNEPDRPAASIFPPQEDLPVFRCQRAAHRLQGRQAAAAVYFRAWQDRAFAHNCGVDKKAAPPGTRHQARALHGASALCGEIGTADAGDTPRTGRETRPNGRRGKGKGRVRPQLPVAEEKSSAGDKTEPHHRRRPAYAT